MFPNQSTFSVFKNVGFTLVDFLITEHSSLNHFLWLLRSKMSQNEQGLELELFPEY
jgi:hypothetical protein